MNFLMEVLANMIYGYMMDEGDRFDTYKEFFWNLSS